MGQAFYYVQGPVSAWVRFPAVGGGPFVTPTMLKANGVAPTFLGHCEKAPQPSHDPKWKPVFSSVSGEVIPDDELYMGTDVKVVLPLQRFDYDVLLALKAAPRYGRATPAGTEGPYDIGAMLQRNGLGIELWLRNQFYGSVNSSAYPDMPIGSYFPCVRVAGIVTDKEGSDATLAQVLFSAAWVRIAQTGNRVCYTHDPDFFPAATATPG